jgi:Zn-dependent peptidase ImmA (M78 family)
MSRVAVKESLLRWAIERSGHSFDQLLEKFPQIQEWAAGQSKPTLRQLETLAKATLTPLGFFFLDEPPKEPMPIPHYRTVSDKEIGAPSPDLLDTVHAMQRRQAWMRDYLLEQGADPVPLVKSARFSEQPVVIADRLREFLSIDRDWAAQHENWTQALDALRKMMEDAGIMVVVNGIVGNNTRRKLDSGEFRGFVLVDGYAPLVFVNGTDGRAAQMFTLAHELAHLAFGRSAAFDLRRLLPAEDDKERACNVVAAEFLIPETALREFWPTAKGAQEPFQEIARRFKVSSLVAARRALDLEMISREEFFKFYNEDCEKERRLSAKRPSGGNFYATQNLRLSRRFATTVFQAVKEGKLLYLDAYRLTGLHGKTFDQYTASLGVR